MDQEQLNKDISQALPTDPTYISFLENPKPCWSVSSNGFLQHDNLIYIPDSDNLRLKVLHYKHDHILSGYLVRTKQKVLYSGTTLGLVYENMSRTIASPVPLVCVLNPSQTLWPPKTTSYFWMPMELHIYGLHWNPSDILWLRFTLSDCWPTH